MPPGIAVDLLIVSAFMGLFLSVACVAAPSKYDLLYLEVKSLYDKVQYAKCIEACDKIISEQENDFIQAKEYKLLARLYEFESDSFDNKNEKEKSRQCIQQLLTKLESDLPSDEVARLKMKIGHSYRSEGFYSKALRIYVNVEKEYRDDFPKSFAKIAAEKISKINSQQVSVISGSISLEGSDDILGVVVEVFNGFEKSETDTSKSGEYSLPLYSSTPGTKIALYVYKEGYIPAVMTASFDGSGNVVMKEIRMKPVPDDNVSIVAGVVFMPVIGGKRVSHHGISCFLSQKIEINKLSGAINITEKVKGGVISATSDDNGVYTLFLEPGSYLLDQRTITLNKGVGINVNICHGQILVD